MTIGEKLRLWGIGKFGSIKDFADSLGMKPPSLQKYLSNEREPGSGILRKLKDLGCDINWLLSVDDASPPPPPDAEDRIKQLEEENRLLRDSIAHIQLLTQAVNAEKAKRKGKKL